MLFEGFLKRDPAAAEERRRRKADRQVNLQAHAVAEYVTSTGAPQVRFNIGRTPDGLSDETFMDQVGRTTESLLAERSMTTIVSYDPDSSRSLTGAIETASAEGRLPRGADGVRVVFNRIAELCEA